jgi:hypothetical protein
MLLFAGCDSFVEGVDDPIDVIPDESLTDESQIEFVIAGVETSFATSYGAVSTRAGVLSDELIFDRRNPHATNPFDEAIDTGDIPLDSPHTLELHTRLGRFRATADDLIRRVDEIEFEDAELRRRALFTGYFYGGVARYFIAAFGGRNAQEGGGVITTDPKEPGPFIPSNEMYDLALERLQDASANADAREKRTVNTVISRIHLLKGDYAAAREAGSSGLVEGDAPFDALYSPSVGNWFFFDSGPWGQIWVFDFVYKDFADSDPGEQNRIPLATKNGTDDPPTVFYFQNRYADFATPQPFATWQENELILAEVDLRDGDAGSALARVNAVRASWGIGPLDAIDITTLERERRKELWGTGLRLVDQRRFDSWHLGPGTWQFYPIPQAERDINPNL